MQNLYMAMFFFPYLAIQCRQPVVYPLDPQGQKRAIVEIVDK